MKLKKELEFNNIINDILKNEEFIALKYEMHHGISRLDHSLNVALLTYNCCHMLKLDNISEITRAALLHDFFRNDEVDKNSFANHPKIALKNAKKHFKLSQLQENIIVSHMFPVCNVMPKYKEAYLVSLMDKLVAAKECTQYKIPLTIGATFLFFLNFLMVQR